MYTPVFWAIIAILLFDFLLERVLDFLNLQRMKPSLPHELQGIYDAENYRKQQLYSREKMHFSFWTSLLSFILIMAVLFSGGFGWLDYVIRQYTENAIVQALLFFGAIGLVSGVFSLPFDAYGTFVIEEKYGFNKTTHKTFVGDKVKGALLAAIVGGGLLALVVFIYQAIPAYFWLVTLGVLAVFTVFMSMFYSSVLLPLFNKQSPLEEGELRQQIEEYGKSTHFKINNIYVMDGSKRSTKANAFFSGLGPRKRIVLYDTLINELSIKEVVAVLAHEVGHYKRKHTLTGLILSLLSMAVMLFVLNLFLANPELAYALGGQQASFHLGVLAFGMLYSPISFLLGIAMNLLSRKNEYEADDFAKETFEASALISSLKKLSVTSLSNLTPHPLYVFFHYSHPTLLQRIKNLNS